MSGFGNRFINAGYTTAKPLIEIDGYPMVKQAFDLFPGVIDVSFICNKKHLQETNMRSLLLSFAPHAKIYGIDVHKKGPVYAIYQIKEFIDPEKETIVAYCDIGGQWNFIRFLEETRNGGFDGSVPCSYGFHPHMLGNDFYASCKTNGNQLVEIKEKGSYQNNRLINYESCGIYYFRKGWMVTKYFKALMDQDISINDEYFVSLVYNLLVKNGLKVSVFEVDKYVMLGTPHDVETYNNWSKYFSFISKPFIPKDTNITPTMIIPMAGNGQRFINEGYTTPKPLLNINGKPMILRALECLPKSHKQIFICQKQHIKNTDLPNQINQNFSNPIIIELDSVTKGQACSCEIGINHCGVDENEPILITACDYGLIYDQDKYNALLIDSKNDVIVWGFKNSVSGKLNPTMYAWIDSDEDKNVLGIRCKQIPPTNPFYTPAICGTFFFRRAKYFLDGLRQLYKSNVLVNGEFFVDSVIHQNVLDGLKVKLLELDNYVCWGTPNDYKVYNYWLEYFTRYPLSPFGKNLK